MRYGILADSVQDRLDADRALPPVLTRDQVLDEIEGHVLDRTELMSTYSRGD